MQGGNGQSTALVRRDERLDGMPVLSEAMEFGSTMVPTGFLPDHIKTPAQAAAIILTGRELGMTPMRSLRSLAIVKGKVVENADSQLSRFKDAGGHAVFETLDATKAVLHLRHPNGDEHTEAFTIEDAKRAGLVGGHNWQKYPIAMLRSRCITSGLKSIGWSGSAGAYDPDEAREFDTPRQQRPAPIELRRTATISMDDVKPASRPKQEQQASEPVEDVNKDEDDERVPCQFCGETYTSRGLTRHENKCDDNPDNQQDDWAYPEESAALVPAATVVDELAISPKQLRRAMGEARIGAVNDEGDMIFGSRVQGTDLVDLAAVKAAVDAHIVGGDE